MSHYNYSITLYGFCIIRSLMSKQSADVNLVTQGLLVKLILTTVPRIHVSMELALI